MNKNSKGNDKVSRQLLVSLKRNSEIRTLTMFPHMSLLISFVQFNKQRGMERGLTCKSLVLEIVALQTSQITQVSFFSGGGG